MSLQSKKCTKCVVAIRFQDYNSGYHNFDNGILLTLKLCDSIKSGIRVSPNLKNILKLRYWKTIFKSYLCLQVHVCYEKTMKLFFKDITYNETRIRNGFYHFVCLQDTEYSFLCKQCGPDPPLIIGDENWKNTCAVDGKY